MAIIRADQHATTTNQEYTWEVIDGDRLASIISQIALGSVVHARCIIDDIDPEDLEGATDQDIDQAIKYLKESQVSHRDGWMFQVISWIAACEENDLDFIKAPHFRATHQGFDGVMLKISGDKKSIDFILISEDKATDSPRDVFRDDILPAFCELEKGNQDTHLRFTLENIIKGITLDPRIVLNTSEWRNKKRYRACITTSSRNLPQRITVFNDYATKIPGDILKRNGHLLIHDDMRSYFIENTEAVCQKLEEMRANV
jgi:hypothetical protein